MSSAQIQLTLVKFWHAVGGLYIWEFTTTLDYEWRIIRGELSYRWTSLIYSFARVTALVGTVLFLATLDITTQINCQLWVMFSAILFCLSATAASLLIALRTIAIWNSKKVVVGLAIILWATSIAFHIHNIAMLSYAWSPTDLACVLHRTVPSTLSFIPTIITDTSLLMIILAGLWILRRDGGGKVGLTHLIWKQGVIWLALGCAAGISQLVFTLLHSSDQYNVMFEIPSVITMVIATTRMHRSLVTFAFRPSDLTHECSQVSSIVFVKTKQTDTSPIAPNRIEVVVDTTFKQHPTSSKSDDDSSIIISTGEQMPEIVVNLSKLNLTRESTCPLPNISASPIPQAQGV